MGALLGIYSVSRKILNKTIKKFLTCHFSLREKSSASKILRMHKISPSGRDDIFFIYVMKFWFRLGRVRYRKKFRKNRRLRKGHSVLILLLRANMFSR
uniref:Uncharacterized protein n=2 Tax=Candidatus Kentrum sp. LPFa TaxID=2126335 RepID=A0A450X5I1_9GAMM|nr:MAG: hypothetical protein BECKLPF1236C_GA0070990_1001410 [Candidatus Kentron sp. LPFa]